MAGRNKAREESPATPPEPPHAGQDDHGNVRPADDRYLTEEQVEARDAYVAHVEAGGDQ